MLRIKQDQYRLGGRGQIAYFRLAVDDDAIHGAFDPGVSQVHLRFFHRLSEPIHVGLGLFATGIGDIQVGLRNRTDNERLQLQVQTLFFNESGQVLYSQPGSEAAWDTIVLTPNKTSYYSATSLTPEAVRFVVRVRRTGKRN